MFLLYPRTDMGHSGAGEVPFPGTHVLQRGCRSDRGEYLLL